MVKLLFSTIAMSLLISTSILGREVEVPAHKEWQFEKKTFEQTHFELKGQMVSTIDWKEDPDLGTDIHRWITKTQIQSSTPDWMARLRNSRQMELVGRILSCAGRCEVIRGMSRVDGQFQSRLLEGDELALSDDSTAWVYLIDGGLLRLSAKTAVTFQEINFSKEEIFIYLKLLEGHIHYLPRTSKEELVDLGPETDAHSLPLMIKEANEAHFEREIFKSQNSIGQINEYLFYGKHSKKHQFLFLNELKKKNNEATRMKSTLMIASPNMTVNSEKVSFDMMYLLGSKGYIKKKSEGSLSLTLRGYTRAEGFQITDSEWTEVTENGRGFEKMNSQNRDLQLLELLTKRVVSFKIAQEIWYKGYTIPILENLSKPKDLAEKYGYFLWERNFGERKTFLDEYVRRLETTHLRSLDNLISKMENRGEKLVKTPTDVYYRKALDSYLWSLKTRYNLDKMQIRETNNLQYYVWILKNVKAKNL